MKGGFGMRKLLALVTALVLLCSLTGCGNNGKGKGFLLPIDDEPTQLDPQTATDSSAVTVLSLLFEGLARLDENGNAVSGAAEWTVSEDGLTYTFTLRESYWSTISVRGETTPWDEPTRVTADDFVFGLQRVLSKENKTGTATALYGIQNAENVHKGKKKVSELGVKAESDTSLTITLTEPDDTFPTRLATTPFMPCDREFFEYTEGRYGLEPQYVLSNGAFSLTAWNHDQSLLLNKNERYHNENAVLPSGVRFVIGTEDPTAALTEGALDAAFLAADDADTVRDAGLTVLSMEDSVRSVYFNSDVPLLNNENVRRALRNAIEWTTVYDYLTEIGEEKATGYIPPDATVGGKQYRDGRNAAAFSTQVDKAKDAFAKGLLAVYPDEQTPDVPKLTVLAAKDDDTATLAKYITQSWKKNLGLSCSLKLVSEDILAERVNSGEYQIALYTATGGGLTASENLAAFTTDAANNLTGISDTAFDKAYANTIGGKYEQVVHAETILRAVCPTIPLSFPRRYYGVAANCEGIVVHPFGGGVYGGEYDLFHAKKYDD